jgi:hypothetical protein
MKYAFYGIFLVAIAVLAYYLVESIRRPVNFHNTWAARKVVVYKHLEDIVELQKMYKVIHEDSTYAGSFDEMLNTFLSDSFSILRIEGDPYDTLKKADTIRMRLCAKDSMGGYLAKKGFISAEELEKNRTDQKFLEEKVRQYMTKMRTVPFSANKELNIAAKEFTIKSGSLTLEGSRLASNFATPTFEVSTTVGEYMPEFVSDEFSMYNPDFVPKKVIKVGDLNKVTTAGNW